MINERDSYRTLVKGLAQGLAKEVASETGKHFKEIKEMWGMGGRGRSPRRKFKLLLAQVGLFFAKRMVFTLVEFEIPRHVPTS